MRAHHVFTSVPVPPCHSSLPLPPQMLPYPIHQFFVRALEPGSGASFVHRALLLADILLPWLATLVWIAAVPPLLLGRMTRGGGDQEDGVRGVVAELALRVGVTGLAATARLAVGRLQIQAYLEGVKESALKELRERKVRRSFALAAVPSRPAFGGAAEVGCRALGSQAAATAATGGGGGGLLVVPPVV